MRTFCIPLLCAVCFDRISISHAVTNDNSLMQIYLKYFHGAYIDVSHGIGIEEGLGNV